MYCGSCGAALTPGGLFCGRCGAPVQHQAPATPAQDASAEATIVRPTQPAAPTAPPAYTPPPAATPPSYTPPPVAPPAYAPPPVAGYPSAPGTPKAPNASVLATQQQLVNVLAWDWKGPLRVAGSMLGVSFILSLIFAFMTKPSGTNFSVRTMLTYIASYWNGTFGASVTGGGNGSSFGAGATPLTLTVITLIVGIMVFRNATRYYTSGVSAIMFAVRAAFFTVIPLLIVSWAITMGSSDISKYGNSTSDHSWSQLHLRFFGSTVAGFDSLQLTSPTSVGISATATFFFTLLLVVLVLSSVALLRRDWFADGIVGKIRAYLAGPLRAFGWLMLALTVVGLVFNIFVLAAQVIDHHSIVPSGSGHMKVQDWLTMIGLLIAYSANAGLQALGMGSAVQYGTFLSGGSGGSGSTDTAYLLGHIASGNEADFGVWTALLLAPAVLAFVAYKTLKGNGADHRASLRDVWTAPTGWLALIPIAVVFSNWTLSVSGDGQSGEAARGISTLGATFLIPLYFLIVGLLVAWFTGVLTPAHLDGIKNFAANVNQAAQANQQQGYPAAPPSYPGQQGVPPAYQPPAGAPPAYQPPVAPPPYQPPTEFPPPPTA